MLAAATGVALVAMAIGILLGGGWLRPAGNVGPAAGSPSAALSPTPNPTGSPMPSATPTAGAAAYGILIKDFLTTDASSYLISIVDTDGNVVARANPAKRSRPAGVLVQMPNVSTSNSRLYYLDGDSIVKVLAPDGTGGTVRTLPVDSNSTAVIAVSPDDRRIAVGIVTYPFPAKSRIYVEDLAGGNHVELFASSTVLEWPVGWHEGRLVVGVGVNAQPQNAYEGFAYGPMGYRLLDADSGNQVGTVCAGRAVYGSPVAAGTICENTSISYLVADWTGATRTVPSSPTCPAGVLAPDGSLSADSCYGGMMRLVDRYGTMLDGGGLSATPIGWIDSSNYIAQAPAGQLSVFHVGSQTDHYPVSWVTGIVASGFFAGRIPGAL